MLGQLLDIAIGTDRDASFDSNFLNRLQASRKLLIFLLNFCGARMRFENRRNKIRCLFLTPS